MARARERLTLHVKLLPERIGLVPSPPDAATAQHPDLEAPRTIRGTSE